MENEIRGHIFDGFTELKCFLIDEGYENYNIDINVKNGLLDYNQSEIFSNLTDNFGITQWLSGHEIWVRESWGGLIFDDTNHLLRETSRRWVIGYFPCYMTTIRFKIDYSKKIKQDTCEKKISESVDMSVNMLNHLIFTKQISGTWLGEERRYGRYKIILVSVVPELIILRQRKDSKITNVFYGR